MMAGILSCAKKSTPIPNYTGKVDTNKTLITNKALVGNWNIVTDTISFQGNNIMYHGTPADHYNFTKYGNLYIKEGLQNFTDTAVYDISSINFQVSWINNYISVNGAVSTIPSNSPPYAITTLDSANLVLTSNYQTAQGQRYEQIKFKK